MILRIMRKSMVDDGVGQLVEFLGGLKTSGVFVQSFRIQWDPPINLP